MNKNNSLGVFFSFATTFELWNEKGLASRELKILYDLACDLNLKLILFTYGNGVRERKVLDVFLRNNRSYNPQNIELIGIPSLFYNVVGRKIYPFLLPIIHFRTLFDCYYLKTLQLTGAIPLIITKILLPNKKYLIRTGYDHIDFLKRLNTPKNKIRKWRIIETIGCRMKVPFSVSSNLDVRNLLLRNKRCTVFKIPNYINTELFKESSGKEDNTFIFIGRISEQKNLENTVKAIHESKSSLDVIGSIYDLDLYNKLSKLPEWSSIKYLGTLDNQRLPEKLSEYKFILLFSHFEGTPKALLEGMACGCIPVVTMVDGIKEIAIGTNAIKAQSVEKHHLIEAIERAKNLNKDEMEKLKINSREYVVNYHSLKNIIKKEIDIINKL